MTPGAWDRDWLFTQLCSPAWQGRKKLPEPWVRVPLCEQTGCLRGGWWEFLAFPGLGRCPFWTRRQKHNKNLPPSLPDLSISLWQTVISFFFPSKIFFSFSFKLSPGQRGKRLFAHVLICQTRHHHALTPFWEQVLAFPRCSQRGTSQHNSPPAQTHSFKNKYCLFFPFF